MDNGNFYEDEDYEATVRAHFSKWDLDFGRVKVHRGFSNDPKLLRELEGEVFHVVYVDGDHTHQGVLHDFVTFGPRWCWVAGSLPTMPARTSRAPRSGKATRP